MWNKAKSHPNTLLNMIPPLIKNRNHLHQTTFFCVDLSRKTSPVNPRNLRKNFFWILDIPKLPYPALACPFLCLLVLYHLLYDLSFSFLLLISFLLADHWNGRNRNDVQGGYVQQVHDQVLTLIPYITIYCATGMWQNHGISIWTLSGSNIF